MLPLLLTFFFVWLKMDKKWLFISCVKLRKATINFVMSVRPSVHMDGTCIFFEHLSGKFNFHVNRTGTTAL